MPFVWRLLGQEARLASLAGLPFSAGAGEGPRAGDARDRYECVVAREAPGPPERGGPYERLARGVRGYDVFPRWMVRALVPRRPLEVGDTFGTCYHLAPGVDLFFGGRVTEVFAGREGDVYRAGFTFRTLAGHPKTGEETFWAEKEAGSGVVRVGVRSWSRDATWLSRAASPLVRWLQVRAGRAALRHLRGVARRGHPRSHGPSGESMSQQRV